METVMAKDKKKNTAGAVAAPDPYAGVKELYDWILCMIFALTVCVLLFAFCFNVIDVVGSSMYPTLHNGEKMLVSNLFYKPKVGDVIIFKKAEYDPNKALVKRVIATEGQEINMDFENGIVYIDGAPIAENYISELTHNKLDFIGPKTVPEGCVFVMGDNRNMSIDSRKAEIGMLDNRLILGKAYAVIYPLSEVKVIQ
jgi:signal peptidase I